MAEAPASLNPAQLDAVHHLSGPCLVLWTRLMGIDLPPSVPVQWELARDEAFTDIAARGTETAEAAWAHSVHAEPAALSPGRWYWYRFTALGQRSPVGRTRTAPADDATATLRFAIASCQRWDHGHFAAWRHLATQPLDLVMFLGDYIYEYPSRPDAVRAVDGPLLRTLAQYRQRYAQYKGDEALQAAHAAMPWLMIWDDHEVENDHSRERGQTLSGAAFQALRAAAYQAWWEHMPVAQAMRPVGPELRIYDRFRWGRLASIHALDDRQYRDPQPCQPPDRGGATRVTEEACPALNDPARSLLGQAQEAWLAEGLRLGRSRWTLVAQQTRMARFGGDLTPPVYWTDGWDGYPPARRRLLETLAQRGRGQGTPLVLGGDVHAFMAADLRPDFDRPETPSVAVEFVGTSITSQSGARYAVPYARDPHIAFADASQRGWLALKLTPGRAEAEMMALADVRDRMTTASVLRRFTVEAGRPLLVPG